MPAVVVARMRCIIVGYGRVGRRTASTLRDEGHDVAVVDSDRERVERARDEEFTAVEGDGGTAETLRPAGVADADAVAGLTGDINANFSACVVGDAHGCRTVLRVDKNVGDALYDRYSDIADEVIYPERLGAAGAKAALLGGTFEVVAELAEQLSMASVTVPEDAPVVGERVVEIELPGEAHICAHGRADGEMTVPLPQTRVEAGDSVGVVVDPERLPEVRSALRGSSAAG
jgi:trk system potassium uptake protein TrkA